LARGSLACSFQSVIRLAVKPGSLSAAGVILSSRKVGFDRGWGFHAAKEGDRRHVSDRKRRVVAVRIDRSNTVDVLKVALSDK
jgi:hypothetical protein